MSSYLAEVLSSVEKMELEQINAKCPEITQAVERCKNDVNSYIENVYVRFIERPKTNKALASKVNQLESEITNLINNIGEITKKDISRAQNELKSQLNLLAKNSIAISLVSTLCKIHQLLVNIEELRKKRCYHDCFKEIFAAEALISSLNLDENLDALQEMQVKLITVKTLLLNKLSEIFRENIIHAVVDNKSVLKVKNETVEMGKVLSALYSYRSSITLLDKVTRFLWDHVFVPIVDFTTEIKVDAEDNFAILEVMIVDPNKKSSYVEVFANIKTVLEFLLSYLNIAISEDMSTLTYIGNDIRDNLSEIIIKHCLQDTVPVDEEGLKDYNVVVKATQLLENDLKMAKIFAEDTTSILDYANNIDVVFINNKCEAYICQADDLMKKDLHDMVEVGEAEESLSSEKVIFPRCCVSHSVIQFLDLLEIILVQASKSSEVCAGRLLCTANLLCGKYGIFVPEYHKKLLQTIPQQVALFYNNCRYISHKLFEWNETRLTKLPPVLKIDPCILKTEGEQLSEIALDKFNQFVDSQKKQIEEIMRSSELEKPTLEQLDATTEKSVRQCLRQQELLKTVWSKVLPYTVYNKTLGDILNSLCGYIIGVVVKFEDISSDAAEQLVELFKMIQTRGPKLFTDPKEISLFVPLWYKLNELAFVLNASLVDINDRWADGKGPLALQFKPEELRQLVRALFQNTEKRATLLAKIREL